MLVEGNFHAQMSWLNMEVTETSALIEMYAKCGSMLEAKQVFAIRQARSLIEWTSLILDMHMFLFKGSFLI